MPFFSLQGSLIVRATDYTEFIRFKVIEHLLCVGYDGLSEYNERLWQTWGPCPSEASSLVNGRQRSEQSNCHFLTQKGSSGGATPLSAALIADSSVTGRRATKQAAGKAGQRAAYVIIDTPYRNRDADSVKKGSTLGIEVTSKECHPD